MVSFFDLLRRNLRREKTDMYKKWCSVSASPRCRGREGDDDDDDDEPVSDEGVTEKSASFSRKDLVVEESAYPESSS